MSKDPMTDKELEALLAQARRPVAPADAKYRLLQAVAKTPQVAPNVVALPARASRKPSRLPWLSALPLAASLAFGIWMGAVGAAPDTLAYLTGIETSDDDETGAGLEEAEQYLEELLS